MVLLLTAISLKFYECQSQPKIWTITWVGFKKKYPYLNILLNWHVQIWDVYPVLEIILNKQKVTKIITIYDLIFYVYMSLEIV